LYIAGHGTTRVQVPFLRDPFQPTPRFAAKAQAAFRAKLLEHPAYARPAHIQQEQQAFLAAWLEGLAALPSSVADSTGTAPKPAARKRRRSANSTEAPPLPQDPEDSPLSI